MYKRKSQRRTKRKKHSRRRRKVDHRKSYYRFDIAGANFSGGSRPIRSRKKAIKEYKELIGKGYQVTVFRKTRSRWKIATLTR